MHHSLIYKARSPTCRCPHNENKLNNSTVTNYFSPNSKTPTFYNEFMLQQKNHPKRQNPNVQNRYSRQFSTNITNTRPVTPQQSMNELLIRQNQFLMNELLKTQLKEAKYKQQLRQLRQLKGGNFRKKQSDSTFRGNQNYAHIKISDKNKDSPQQSIQKQSSRVYISAKTMQTEQDFADSVLNESMEYVKQTGRSIQNQIEHLNQKLCQLLESTSCEQNKQQKFRQRVEMSNCIKQLQQLRKCYQNSKS